MSRQLILLLLLISAIGGYVVIQNARLNSAEQRARLAESKAAMLQAERDEARNNIRIVTEYVDRVQIVRERGATITQEIPAHVTAQADARCAVPAGFVSVHDAAAQNLPLAGPAGDPDAPAEGLALSAVATTVAGNYTTCHENAEQLTALQDYVRALQGIERP